MAGTRPPASPRAPTRPSPDADARRRRPAGAGIAIPGRPASPSDAVDFASRWTTTRPTSTMRGRRSADRARRLQAAAPLTAPRAAERPETDVTDAGFPGAGGDRHRHRPRHRAAGWPAWPTTWPATGAARSRFEARAASTPPAPADTWSNDTQGPTGWAFTNIRTGGCRRARARHRRRRPPAAHRSTSCTSPDDDRRVARRSPGRTTNDGTATRPVGAGGPTGSRCPSSRTALQAEVGVEVVVRGDSASGPGGGVAAPSPSTATTAPSSTSRSTPGRGRLRPLSPSSTRTTTRRGHRGQQRPERQRLGRARRPGRCSSSTTTGPATPSGSTPAPWPRSASRTPSPSATSTADELAAYDAVIWVEHARPRRRASSTTADRAAIAEYLGGGGKLWLSSEPCDRGADRRGSGGRSPPSGSGSTWIDIDSFYEPVRFVTEDILATQTPRGRGAPRAALRRQVRAGRRARRRGDEPWRAEGIGHAATTASAILGARLEGRRRGHRRSRRSSTGSACRR